MSLTITVTPGRVRRAVEAVGRITAGERILADQLTGHEIAEVMALFRPWRVGEFLEADDLRVYDDKLYKINQDHTTQAGWLPPDESALYTEVAPPGTIPEWSPREGAHDAFRIGEKVTHNGRLWLSHHDSNGWEPGTVDASIWEDIGPA